MKYPNLSEQENRDAAAFTFFDFSAQGGKQRLNVAPRNATGYGTLKQLSQGSLMFLIHVCMIAKYDIMSTYLHSIKNGPAEARRVLSQTCDITGCGRPLP